MLADPKILFNIEICLFLNVKPPHDIRVSAGKAPTYCPLSEGRAGEGLKKSFCDRLWRNETLLEIIEGNEIFSWTSKAIGMGASTLGPAIQFVAGNCLSFFRQ